MEGVSVESPSLVSLDVVLPLLDDPSAATRNALTALFERQRAEAVPFLRDQLAVATDPVVRAAAESYLEALGGVDTLGEFRAFIESERFELETGALLLHRVVDPGLSVASLVGQLDAMAARCLELIVRPASVGELCRVMNRVLFHEWGFRGDHEDFENPANSLLGEVVARRRGLPISLGTIYLLVGRRIGLEFEPICLPGRFMIAHFGGADPIYVDAFEGGRMRSVEEVSDFLRENDLPASPGDFGPASTVEVLARMSRNLADHYHRAGELKRAHLFIDLAESLALHTSAE